MTVPQKIRRQRKADSRERLLTAAGKLFAEFGYDDTTLESVADMAGLHVQTLYRHFPTKDELSASLMYENLMRFETFFHARQCDALGTWRDWIERTTRAIVRQGGPRPQHVLWAAPTVSTKLLEYWDRYQVVLAQGIAEDVGVDVATDMRPILIACMLWGGNHQAHVTWLKSGRRDGDSYVAALLRVVDTVRDLFPDLLTSAN
jgi:AcrR family transcriptional regulator